MNVNEVFEAMAQLRTAGRGNEDVRVVHASAGDPEHKYSGAFAVLAVDTQHGINLVQSNYVTNYVPLVVDDVPESEEEKDYARTLDEQRRNAGR